MGEIARGDRADRFMKEFGPDFKKLHAAADEATKPIKVLGLRLGYDTYDGRVITVIHVEIGGKETTFRADDFHFDAEYFDATDALEALVSDLGLGHEEAKARLIKAELYSEGDFKTS